MRLRMPKAMSGSMTRPMTTPLDALNFTPHRFSVSQDPPGGAAMRRLTRTTTPREDALRPAAWGSSSRRRSETENRRLS